MAAPRTAAPTGRHRALIAVAAVAAAGTWVWLLLPLTPTPLEAPPPEGASTLDDTAATAPTSPEPLRESSAAVRLRELRSMSETFRNTTFLGTIRAAGFVCYSLENVYGGVNDSTTWTVSCADMLAYSVSVDEAGALVVEPTMQFLDSAPFTAPRDEGPLPEPTLRRPLPRQR